MVSIAADLICSFFFFFCQSVFLEHMLYSRYGNSKRIMVLVSGNHINGCMNKYGEKSTVREPHMYRKLGSQKKDTCPPHKPGVSLHKAKVRLTVVAFWPGRHLSSNKKKRKVETGWPKSFAKPLAIFTILKGPSQNWWCFLPVHKSLRLPHLLKVLVFCHIYTNTKTKQSNNNKNNPFVCS